MIPKDFQTPLTKEMLQKIEQRILGSTLIQDKQKKLITNLHQYSNAKNHSTDLAIKNFFKPYLDHNGNISQNILTSQKNRKINHITEHQKILLDLISEKINSRKSNRTIVFNHSKNSDLDINNFHLNNESSSHPLNKFNYADFIEGNLPQHIRPKITLIAAYDHNYGIGNKGSLPWHIPEDLQWFKEKTAGKPIIMGRTNFDDIYQVTKGQGLPKRRNIVLSRTPRSVQNFEFFTNVADILNSLKDEKEIVIIGGTMLYETFLPIADEIIITEIDKKYETDVKFPKFKDKFICVSHIKETASKKEQVDLHFKRYARMEPPSMTGVSHINKNHVSYDYTKNDFIAEKYRNNHNDIFFFDVLTSIPSDILSYSLIELILSNPLPVQLLDTLIHTGSYIINPSESIFPWMIDYYSSLMSSPSSATTDALLLMADKSNSDFSLDLDSFFDAFGDFLDSIGDLFDAF